MINKHLLPLLKLATGPYHPKTQSLAFNCLYHLADRNIDAYEITCIDFFSEHPPKTPKTIKLLEEFEVSLETPKPTTIKIVNFTRLDLISYLQKMPSLHNCHLNVLEKAVKYGIQFRLAKYPANNLFLMNLCEALFEKLQLARAFMPVSTRSKGPTATSSSKTEKTIKHNIQADIANKSFLLLRLLAKTTGFADAYYFLGCYFKYIADKTTAVTAETQALNYFFIAKKAGSFYADYELGLHYYSKHKSSATMTAMAKIHLAIAAKSNIPDAQYHYAKILHATAGQTNNKEALFWLKKAASAEHIKASEYLLIHFEIETTEPSERRSPDHIRHASTPFWTEIDPTQTLDLSRITAPLKS